HCSVWAGDGPFPARLYSCACPVTRRLRAKLFGGHIEGTRGISIGETVTRQSFEPLIGLLVLGQNFVPGVTQLFSVVGERISTPGPLLDTIDFWIGEAFGHFDLIALSGEFAGCEARRGIGVGAAGRNRGDRVSIR